MRAPFRPSFTSDVGVVRNRAAVAARGHRILGIFADDHLEDGGGVFDRARHRAGDVGEIAERNHARAARQAHRRSNADERVVRRRPANRVAGVGAEADEAEVGGDGRGRAAARSGRHARRGRTGCASCRGSS